MKKINLSVSKRKQNESEKDFLVDIILPFIRKNAANIVFLVVLTLFIPIYFFFFKPYNISKNEKAQTEMFRSVYYFQEKNYDTALNGDDNSVGLLQIANKYKSTKSGKLANYYIGVIHLQNKDFDNAITYLKKFNTNDLIIKSRSLSLIGDAYSELKNYKLASDYYLKAAKNNPDSVFSPKYYKKAAINLIALEKINEAIDCFQQIIDLFPNCNLASEAKKRILILKNSN